MVQGTTPLIELNINQDITDCTVYVSLKDVTTETVTTYKNGDDEFVSMSEYGGVTTIMLRLTQAETLALSVGQIDIQVRFINSDGEAGITNVRRVSNLESLYTEVIEYVAPEEEVEEQEET